MQTLQSEALQVLAAAFCVVLSAGSVFAGENLLSNGDFENLNKVGLPVGWTVVANRDGKYVSSLKGYIEISKDAHSGSNSLHFIGNPDYIENASIPGAVSLKTSTIYSFSFWYKTRDLKRGRPKFYLFGEAYYLEDATEWRRYQKSFNSGERQTFSAYFSFLKRAGDWWLDDVQLTKVQPYSAPIETGAIRLIDDTPMPKLSEQQESKGYVVFTRNWLDLVYPASVPLEHELNAELTAFATPGEYEPIPHFPGEPYDPMQPMSSSPCILQ